ncbi:trypsin-like peptidase domain-containing protein [Paenibacillus sp. HB172176]|uniref:S1C family serine protease n=1 Tax=Paenibacillus sp. HB172176 TaxID=2493690 RepID=UPI00143AF1F2|nr:trypsin-like peptidase domain-containing protein [Paenibacillus sp. HB172176]
MNHDTYEHESKPNSQAREHTNTTNEFEAYYKEVGQQPVGKKQRKTKRNRVAPLAAAFLAGAIVIGGLTYSADEMNLFTGGAAASEATAGQTSSSAVGAGSGLTTASLSTSSDLASIYEQASPAVVKVENYVQPQRSSMSANPFFQELFGYRGQGRGGSQDGSQGQSQDDQQSSSDENLELYGTGTGFFFDEEGYILTNEHVIDGAAQVKVTVEGYDEPLVAEVLGSSTDLDLAVLKVTNPNGESFPSLTLGNSDNTKIGDWVMAIGNPYGFDSTLTMGVLSAKERPITIQGEDGQAHTYEHLLQTDASINPGNSGGPLLNTSGEVIGINSAVNAEAQGIGFAIPTTTILNVLDDLKAG